MIEDLGVPSPKVNLEKEDLDWSKLIEPGICDISIEREINAPQALNVLGYLQVTYIFRSNFQDVGNNEENYPE